MVAVTRPVESHVEICREIHKDFPRSTGFTPQLNFYREKFYHGLLHTYTVFAIQRRLNREGIAAVILPMQVA